MHNFSRAKQVILAFAESDVADFEGGEQSLIKDLIHLSLHNATDLETSKPNTSIKCEPKETIYIIKGTMGLYKAPSLLPQEKETKRIQGRYYYSGYTKSSKPNCICKKAAR